MLWIIEDGNYVGDLNEGHYYELTDLPEYVYHNYPRMVRMYLPRSQICSQGTAGFLNQTSARDLILIYHNESFYG